MNPIIDFLYIEVHKDGSFSKNFMHREICILILIQNINVIADIKVIGIIEFWGTTTIHIFIKKQFKKWNEI